MLRRLSSLGFFGWTALSLVAFILLAYLLENWTGAMALEAARARVAAAGETLDFEKLLPALPPPEENLGALPGLERLTRLGPLEPELEKLNWCNNRESFGHPAPVMLLSGRLDLASWVRYLSERGHLSIAPDATSAALLEAIDAQYPLLKQISDASTQRRCCVFLPMVDRQSRIGSPMSGTEHLGVISTLTRPLAIRAVAAIKVGQLEEGVSSIVAILQFAGGFAKEPYLGSFSGAAKAHDQAMVPLRELLAAPGLNQSQSDVLVQALCSIDFWEAAELAFRGMLTTKLPLELVAPQLALSGVGGANAPRWVVKGLPIGLLDHSEALLIETELSLLQTLGSRDWSQLKALLSKLAAERHRTRGGAYPHHHYQNFVMASRMGFEKDLLYSLALQAQALWHLQGAKGPLPTDPVTGQPMKGDATRMWSVGFNEVDDGGKSHHEVGREGDWVWQALK
jgi:hypothetical protein